jgi:hypothetical protein
MKVACTFAAIAQLLGYQVKPGDVVPVPPAIAAQLTPAQKVRAAACAYRLRLRLQW